MWDTLCDILYISDTKRRELTEEQHRENAIQWWITTDPLASWRRLLDQLYTWGHIRNDEQLLAVGDRLRLYCEELTGMCIHTIPHHE